MKNEKEELEAGVDDSREIEQVEEALTRGPKVCHLCLLSKPNHRSCVTPFIKQLYPLDKDYKEMDIKVANPFALQTQRLHRRGVSVCACAGLAHRYGVWHAVIGREGARQLRSEASCNTDFSLPWASPRPPWA